MIIYGALMRKNGILLLKQYRTQITIVFLNKFLLKHLVFSLKLC